MFQSGKVYKNRYNDKYVFSALEDGKYLFKMEGDSMQYCRYGGKEGQMGLDDQDLGMFDPSGGPYVTIGTEVDGKPITHIRISSLGFVVEV